MRFVDILAYLCYNLLQKRCFGDGGTYDGIRLIFLHRMGARYFGRDAYMVRCRGVRAARIEIGGWTGGCGT